MKKQWICKPGSVPAVRVLAIYLRRPSRDASIVLPSNSDGPPFLALTPMMDAVDASLVYANFPPPVCTARMSPYAWWALTPPSHPYRTSAAVVFFCTCKPSRTSIG